MPNFEDSMTRRTTTSAVYDRLFDEISSLTLLPGAKLSEAEIARRFGVSRQPVRDAFSRLENQDLLLIRPQKATIVRGFSMNQVAHARFVRLAVELEVLRAACLVWDAERDAMLQAQLKEQADAVERKDSEAFHKLDYLFHKTICIQGGLPLAFETIEQSKHKIDRLCMLSLGRGREAGVLLEDHNRIAQALKVQDADAATASARQHLARLDDTISDIHSKHSEYFEDVVNG